MLIYNLKGFFIQGKMVIFFFVIIRDFFFDVDVIVL